MEKKLKEKLEEELGDSPFAKFLIEVLEKSSPDQYNNQVHEFIGVLSSYSRLHLRAKPEALETPLETKIKIAKKALEAVE